MTQPATERPEVRRIGRDDHVPCIGPTGRKLIPYWLLKQWVDARIFDLNTPGHNKSRWEFESFEKGRAGFMKWLHEEQAIAAQIKTWAGVQESIGAQPADEGIAGVSKAAIAKDPFTIFGQPPLPDVEFAERNLPPAPENLGESREKEKPANPRPRDVI